MTQSAQLNFKAIGTLWQIDIYKNLSLEYQSEIFDKIKKRVEEFESNYSRFRDDSIVGKIAKLKDEDCPKNFLLPEDAEKLLGTYKEFYLLTDGLFTPLIGDLLSSAGYDSSYSLKPQETLVKPYDWCDVFEYNHPNLLVKKPVQLDFGAAGKGYIIDLISELIEGEGILNYCIDAGGDIRHRNVNTIKIGLENPINLDQVVGVYDLGNRSMCGSSGNRRAWGNFNHIMNPKTLSSSKEIIAVWVIADTTILADALTTCLFFLPASNFREKYNFEYLIIKSDMSIEKSNNFSGELFLN